MIKIFVNTRVLTLVIFLYFFSKEFYKRMLCVLSYDLRQLEPCIYFDWKASELIRCGVIIHGINVIVIRQ